MVDDLWESVDDETMWQDYLGNFAKSPVFKAIVRARQSPSLTQAMDGDSAMAEASGCSGEGPERCPGGSGRNLNFSWTDDDYAALRETIAQINIQEFNENVRQHAAQFWDIMAILAPNASSDHMNSWWRGLVDSQEEAFLGLYCILYNDLYAPKNLEYNSDSNDYDVEAGEYGVGAGMMYFNDYIEDIYALLRSDRRMHLTDQETILGLLDDIMDMHRDFMEHTPLSDPCKRKKDRVDEASKEELASPNKHQRLMVNAYEPGNVMRVVKIGYQGKTT